MGLLTSRFRHQQTTIEILEDIDKDIKTLQKYRRQNQENQKKFIASLIMYSIILYIISAVVFFLVYFPVKWKDRILHSVPLLIFPLLVWLVKKLLHWHYVKKTSNTDTALVELRDKRKQILEDVMEKETYKKAREILEKFDPTRFKQLEKPVTSPTKSIQAVAQPVSERVPRIPVLTSNFPARPRTPTPVQTQIQYRPRSPPIVQHTPLQQQQQMHAMRTTAQNGSQMWMRYERPPGPPLPRSLLPRDRTSFDKAVDYLFGDGPQNRYALICRQCNSHNGMALKEEFEYISFRCCYCFIFNSARKQKPNAPKLEFPTPVMQRRRILDASRNDDEDEDEDDVDNADTKKNGDSSEVIKSNSPDSTTPNTAKKSEIIPSASQPLNENLVKRKIDNSALTSESIPKKNVLEKKEDPKNV